MDIDKFIKSINKYDNSFQKFTNSPSYKSYFVESHDDILFYKEYLRPLFNVPISHIKFHACGNKDEVLKEFRKNKSPKNAFIVDRDYNNGHNEELIVTTGYSMENFLFYGTKKTKNLHIIFQYYYKLNWENNYDRFEMELYKFANKYKYYYAYLKTSVEKSYYINHKTIRVNLKRFDNIKEIIEENINMIDRNYRAYFRNSYNENLKIIEKKPLLMIRGHDLFDELVAFLKKDNILFKVSDVFKLAYGMKIPYDFLNKLTNER